MMNKKCYVQPSFVVAELRQEEMIACSGSDWDEGQKLLDKTMKVPKPIKTFHQNPSFDHHSNNGKKHK